MLRHTYSFKHHPQCTYLTKKIYSQGPTNLLIIKKKFEKVYILYAHFISKMSFKWKKFYHFVSNDLPCESVGVCEGCAFREDPIVERKWENARLVLARRFLFDDTQFKWGRRTLRMGMTFRQRQNGQTRNPKCLTFRQHFDFGFLLQTTVCIERESVTGWRSFLLPALTKNVLLVHKGQIWRWQLKTRMMKIDSNEQIVNEDK